MNEVSTTGAEQALARLRSGVQNVRNAIPASSAQPILRLLRDGDWAYGAENLTPEEGSLWAVNPMSIQYGYVCWTDYPKEAKRKNDLKGEVYAPMHMDPIDPAALEKHWVDPDDKSLGAWEWKPAVSMQLKCTNGEDAGQEILYKPTSVGGMNAVDSVLKALDEKLNAGTDEIVPLIELAHDHYQHKQYGKTYVPVFNIKSWMTMEGPAEAAPVEAVEADEPVKNEGRRRRRASVA